MMERSVVNNHDTSVAAAVKSVTVDGHRSVVNNNSLANSSVVSCSSVVNNSLANSSVVNCSGVNNSLANSSVVNRSVVNHSLANSSVVNSSGVNSSGVNSSVVNSSVVNSSGVNNSLANSSVVNSSGVNSSRVNNSLANSSVVNSSGVNNSLANSSVVNSSGVNSSGVNSSVENSSGVNSSGVNNSLVNSSGVTTTTAGSAVNNSGRRSLQRSFSEHVKDSTNKAWEVIWRSNRENRLWEIEAKEACDWLKAAGFPQYVQLYRDCRFPVDTDWVRRDHDFLDKDALDSLCRRLSTLNKCVEMRVELGRSKRRVQEHVDEEACCISPRWRYDTRTHHWTRLESEGDNATPSCLDFLPADSAPDSPAGRREPAPSSCDACSLHSTSSTDSEGHRSLQRGPRQTHRGPSTSSSSSSRSFGTSTDDQDLSRSSPGNEAPSLDAPPGEEPPSPPGSSGQSSEAERCFPDVKPPVRRKGPGLLRRMRLRGTSGTLYPGRGPSGAGRAGLGAGTTRPVISGPVLPEEESRVEETDERLRRVLQGRPDSQASSTSSTHAADSSSSSSSASSTSPSASSSAVSSSSPSASSSAVSTPSPVTRVRRSGKRTGVGTAPNGPEEDEGLALHCRHTLADHRPQVNNNNNNSGGHDRLLFHVPRGHKPGTFPASLSRQTPLPLPPLHPGVVTSRTLPGIDHSSSVNWRTGSFHGYRGRGGGDARQQQPPHTDAAGDDDDDDHDDVGGAGIAAEGEADHRASIYDNVPDDQRPSCPFVAPGDGEEPGGDGEEPGGEHRAGAGLLDDGDLFSALDSVMERISLLVASWSRDLSDESPSSPSSPSSSSSSSPSSRTSPAQQRSSAPSHIHLEVQRPEEEGTTALSPPLPPQRRPSLPCSERGVSHGPGIEGLSISQMHLLQKLSLLKLTSLMDKYSPCSKQGWNWTVPKSPRKVKGSELKGRRVFGVPLLLSAQRTGDSLPPSILRALLYLRNHCLDQVGLFRKSGVKSRIQYLREAVEADPEGVRLEGQSAFDVADMVKQYFRDLPEPLFSTRLRESFLHIYQYFPKDQQLAACQAAISLLPDERREALRTLLLFLADVAACVQHNQMTPTNLAVCLAPSLFHLGMLSSRDPHHPQHHHHQHHAQPRSSHRKYSLGRPDQRDLSETLAATQGLAHMVSQATTLFQVPEFWGGQSALVPSEESLLGEGGDGSMEVEEVEEEQAMKERRCRLERNTQLLLKEAAEKNRGWETTHAAAGNHVELSSKQVDDGCPLPLWRCSVEVEAPREEVLQRLLREPELWEEEAGGWAVRRASVLRTLAGGRAEVYRCLLSHEGGLGSALAPRPPRDHLLLRTWQSDPSSGPVYLSSVSTQFPALPAEGVRVQVSSCLYLLEAVGDKRTRLTHLDRTDTRGRSQEWYHTVRGHLLASRLLSIRDSFRPEHRESTI